MDRGYRIFTLMGELGPDLTDHAFDAMEANEKRVERNTKRKIVFLSAACVILALLTVFAISFLKGREPREVTGDFSVESGTLVRYDGVGDTVIIPDGVSKIASSAFSGRVAAQSIRSLTIGKDVGEIEPASFEPLIALESISVAAENRTYETIENVLFKRDGSYVFASIGAFPEKTTDQILMDVIDTMKQNEIELQDNGIIEVGSAVITLERQEDDKIGFIGYKVSEISAFGKTVSFSDEDVWVTGNGKFQAFEADGCLVTGFVSNGGFGKTYFLTGEENIVVETPLCDAEDEYNRSVVTFFCDDVEIRYSRIPFKYFNIQAEGGVMEKCVSKDELYREEGSVRIEDGKVEYKPDNSVTVSEAFDLVAEYEKWCNTIGIDHEDVTLEEYLKSNAEQFNRAN